MNGQMKVVWVMVASLVTAGCSAFTAPQTGGARQVLASRIQSSEIDKTRLTSLEGQLEVLNKRLGEVLENQRALQEELVHLKNRQSAEPRRRAFREQLSNRQVQRALRSAGFYSGSVDGKVGRMTKRALRTFQRAHGLKADGVVGKKTARALAEYLE